MTWTEVNKFLYSNDPPFDYNWYYIKPGEVRSYLFASYDDNGEDLGEYFVILRNSNVKLQCRIKIGTLHDITETTLVEILVRACIEMKKESEKHVQNTNHDSGKV